MNDYKAIRVWGKMMGSDEDYIEQEIGRAKADGAPADAIYKGNAGWRTVHTVTNPSAKRYLIEHGVLEEKED